MYKHLNQEQRYYIDIKKSNNTAIKKISKAIKVHRSTVYRELARNKMSNGNYYYLAAHGKSTVIWAKAKKNTAFAKFRGKVLEFIISELKIHTSPVAISGRLRLRMKVKISSTSIYRYTNYDRSIGGKLFKYLPHSGKKYKTVSSKASKNRNRVDISQRPKIADKKIRIGDHEAISII